MNMPRPASLAALLLCIATSSAAAEIRLASVFGDHMVLQRGIECPLWGTATPGARVDVSIDGKPAVGATADEKGRFRLKLPALEKPGPYALEVRSDKDAATTITDVLAGEVWLASGQSNMQWDLNTVVNRDAEVAAADRPTIRLYYVPRVSVAEPIEAVQARWEVCTPRTAAGFSAVAYFFGRKLNDELGVPVGLIHSSWGGTPAESWTPRDRLESMRKDLPAVNAKLAKAEIGATPEARRAYDAAMLTWLKATHRLDPGIDPKAATWKDEDFDDAAWKTMKLPVNWQSLSVPNGCVWFRREIDVPAEAAGKDLKLSLGAIDDYDTTYFNGQSVGATDHRTPQWFSAPRNYTVPGALVKPGRNVIAVRVFDTGGTAGFVGPSGSMTATIGETKIPLAGEWRYEQESIHRGPEGTPPPQPPAPTLPGNSWYPAGLYNGMIAPLGDFGIRGAIWYQGESNAAEHREYERLLTTMIASWREQFRVGDFPFYIVGLANFHPPVDDPNVPSDWAHLREAQRQVGLKVKNAATTVTIDIGEERDIHPRNKQDVGLRLALIALEETYGKQLVSRGPTLKAARFEEGKVVLSFDHVGGGLEARGGERLASFSIAGEDGKFVWADAAIVGDTVVLTSAAVTQPTVVRYAWAQNPKATLFNKEGLPAEPFEERRK